MGLGPGIRDPGSGKNLFRIPDPGVKKAPDPGSGSATLVCIVLFYRSVWSPDSWTFRTFYVFCPDILVLYRPFERQFGTGWMASLVWKNLFGTGAGQGFGSVFIWYGSGSSMSGWIPVRIKFESGSSSIKNWKKITGEKKNCGIKNYNLPIRRTP